MLARVEPRYRDFSKEKPVSNEVFEVFKRAYAYDKKAPDARVEGEKKRRRTPDDLWSSPILVMRRRNQTAETAGVA